MSDRRRLVPKLMNPLSQNVLCQHPEARALAMDALEAILSAARHDSWMRTELATRSRLHRNGFLKTILVDRDEWSEYSLNGYRLVLHAWDDATVSGHEEQIHDHRWPFWSLLLKGTLEWTHYSTIEEKTETGLPYYRYEYRSPDERSHYSLNYAGKAWLSQRFSATVSDGTRLAMTEVELHKVRWPGVSDTATIFLQGKPARASTNVYIPLPSSTTGDEIIEPSTIVFEVQRKCLPYETISRIISAIVSH